MKENSLQCLQDLPVGDLTRDFISAGLRFSFTGGQNGSLITSLFFHFEDLQQLPIAFVTTQSTYVIGQYKYPKLVNFYTIISDFNIKSRPPMAVRPSTSPLLYQHHLSQPISSERNLLSITQVKQTGNRKIVGISPSSSQKENQFARSLTKHCVEGPNVGFGGASTNGTELLQSHCRIQKCYLITMITHQLPIKMTPDGNLLFYTPQNAQKLASV
eukprot:TRINITY_DN5304_c0_g1_i2.p1 TRINITY_DN5304_c0_g1~~TRINITY_DN5304_c0_g1_i2.p1  ORF type:complete len:215 (-),score=-22.51 TRINITY_DN5304_c0_g1_i2:335-979(-)